MARADAFITPQLLVWARERVSMTAEVAASLVGVKLEKYISWERGECLPTVNQAKKAAKKIKIPYVWLFLDTPPVKYKLPQNTDYRTFANQLIADTSWEMNCYIADIAMRRDAMIDLYEEMDMQIPCFEQYMNVDASDNTAIAQRLRTLLNITIEQQRKFKNSNEAFNYYMEALASLGVLVFQAGKIDKKVMRGMSIYDSIFPIIVVNRKDEFNARIFTLMHEFIHILTRTPGICDTFGIERQSRFDIEIKCNAIAAEALVPQADLLAERSLRRIQESGWSDDEVLKIAKNFSVSREVIIGRILSQGMITLDFYNKKLTQYTEEYEQYKRNQKKSAGFLPPSTDICSQVGKLYARTIMNAYNQEVITPRDTSQFLSGLRVQHFSKVESWCFS